MEVDVPAPRESKLEVPEEDGMYPDHGLPQVELNIGDASASTQLDFHDSGTTGVKKEGEYLHIDDDVARLPTSPSRSSAAGIASGGRFGWMFDVEEDGDDLDNVSLLEELDIDVKGILYKVRAVLIPFNIDRAVLMESPDFWGPMAVVVIYGVLLLWGQMSVMSWVFTLWIVGSLLLFLLARVLGSDVSFSQSVGVIGYSVLPLVICVICLLVLSLVVPSSLVPQSIVRGVVYVSSAAWSTYSAGSLLGCDLPFGKRVMLMYPLLLLFGYFVGLHNGV